MKRRLVGLMMVLTVVLGGCDFWVGRDYWLNYSFPWNVQAELSFKNTKLIAVGVFINVCHGNITPGHTANVCTRNLVRSVQLPEQAAQWNQALNDPDGMGADIWDVITHWCNRNMAFTFDPFGNLYWNVPAPPGGTWSC